MPNNTASPSLSQFSITDLDLLAASLDLSGGACVQPAKADAGASGGGLTPISCPPQIVNFSYDTFHISFDVANNNNGELFKEMEEAKKHLQAGNEKEQVFRFLKNGSDSFVWNIQRTGNKLYPYVFRTGDLILGMSSRPAGSSMPNMCLLVGSISCNSDILSLLRTFKFWLKNIDIAVLSEKVSRADLCSDIKHDIKIGRIEKQMQYITRARDAHVFYSNRKFTGIQWGSKDIVCRIYDKQLQMAQQQQTEKQFFFNNFVWKTEKEEPVTRVEFQLRREAIKEFFKGSGRESVIGCPAPEKDAPDTDVATFIRRSGDLWQYLTTEWLRHCSGYVDRENNNQERAVVSPFWQIVQQAGALVRSEPVKRNRSQKHINVPALRKQAAGILTTIAAAIGHPGECFFNLIGTITDIVSEDIAAVMAEIGFGDKYLAKQTRCVVSF